MRKLIKGIVDFRRNIMPDYCTKFAKLALEQKPDALFVACCDSRVVPNVFASSDPGDLFVVRNMGNIIPACQNNTPPDASVAAALAFSLNSLNVADIIICGHSECGAMHSLIEYSDNINTQHPLQSWLQYAIPSYEKFQRAIQNSNTKLTACNFLSQINVLQQLENLQTYPLVAELLHNHKLRIHGWWFDLTTADVYYYKTTADKFVIIDEIEATSMLSEFA